MSIKLFCYFAISLCSFVPTFAAAYGYGFNDQIDEEQQQLDNDQETLAKLQELVYAANPAEVLIVSFKLLDLNMECH